MSESISHKIKLLVTIVDRKNGNAIVKTLAKNGFYYNMMLLGRGTAPTEWIDLLGLGDTAKYVILSFVPSPVTAQTLRALQSDHRFCEAGNGIAFTVPLDGVGGKKTLEFLSQFSSTTQSIQNEESNMEVELVITIVNRGFADEVMDAARAAGATGGTVLYARGTGTQEAEQFFGITIQPEKEVVLVLAQKEQRNAIMKNVCAKVGLNTAGHGISFSLPVDEVAGAALLGKYCK